MKRKLIGTTLLLIGILVAIPSLYGIPKSIFLVPTSGSISMVKLYWDAACTNEVTHISWGSIIPGTTVNQTIYIKNFGGAPVNIILEAINWTTNPEASSNYTASDYITFSDSFSGQNVTAHFVQQDTLFLTVSPTITDTTISTFSFNIQVNEEW